MHHSNSPQQRRALGAMEAAASSSSSSHGDEGVRLQRTVERLQALVVDAEEGKPVEASLLGEQLKRVRNAADRAMKGRGDALRDPAVTSPLGHALPHLLGRPQDEELCQAACHIIPTLARALTQHGSALALRLLPRLLDRLQDGQSTASAAYTGACALISHCYDAEGGALPPVLTRMMAADAAETSRTDAQPLLDPQARRQLYQLLKIALEKWPVQSVRPHMPLVASCIAADAGAADPGRWEVGLKALTYLGSKWQAEGAHIFRGMSGERQQRMIQAHPEFRVPAGSSASSRSSRRSSPGAMVSPPSRLTSRINPPHSSSAFSLGSGARSNKRSMSGGGKKSAGTEAEGTSETRVRRTRSRSSPDGGSSVQQQQQQQDRVRQLLQWKFQRDRGFAEAALAAPVDFALSSEDGSTCSSLRSDGRNSVSGNSDRGSANGSAAARRYEELQRRKRLMMSPTLREGIVGVVSPPLGMGEGGMTPLERLQRDLRLQQLSLSSSSPGTGGLAGAMAAEALLEEEGEGKGEPSPAAVGEEKVKAAAMGEGKEEEAGAAEGREAVGRDDDVVPARVQQAPEPEPTTRVEQETAPVPPAAAAAAPMPPPPSAPVSAPEQPPPAVAPVSLTIVRSPIEEQQQPQKQAGEGEGNPPSEMPGRPRQVENGGNYPGNAAPDAVPAVTAAVVVANSKSAGGGAAGGGGSKKRVSFSVEECVVIAAPPAALSEEEEEEGKELPESIVEEGEGEEGETLVVQEEMGGEEGILPLVEMVMEAVVERVGSEEGEGEEEEEQEENYDADLEKEKKEEEDEEDEEEEVKLAAIGVGAVYDEMVIEEEEDEEEEAKWEIHDVTDTEPTAPLSYKPSPSSTTNYSYPMSRTLFLATTAAVAVAVLLGTAALRKYPSSAMQQQPAPVLLGPEWSLDLEREAPVVLRPSFHAQAEEENGAAAAAARVATPAISQKTEKHTATPPKETSSTTTTPAAVAATAAKRWPFFGVVPPPPPQIKPAMPPGATAEEKEGERDAALIRPQEESQHMHHLIHIPRRSKFWGRVGKVVNRSVAMRLFGVLLALGMAVLSLV